MLVVDLCNDTAARALPLRTTPYPRLPHPRLYHHSEEMLLFFVLTSRLTLPGRCPSLPCPFPNSPLRTLGKTGHYVFLLGTYRALYIFNWVYRAYTEAHYQHHPLLYFAALVQTLLYADFFYYYVIRYGHAHHAFKQLV